MKSPTEKESGLAPSVSEEVVDTQDGEMYTKDNLAAQEPTDGLAHTLSSRHLTMLSIGSSIGMGLWLGSGTSLRNGGPAGIFLGYLLASTIAMAVNQSVGELAILYPIPSAFSQWPNKFVDRSFAFTVGWGYWFSTAITLSNELQGVSTVLHFWTDKIPTAGWLSIFLVVVFLITISPVTVFGEIEVVMSTIKLVWIFVVVIACIVISAGGAPNHQHTGFQYWNDDPFTNGFKGFLTVLGTCVFAMEGTEIAGLSAAEARNPLKAIPKAVNSVWARLGLFYLVGSLMVTITVSPYNPSVFGGSGTNASPYVVAFRDAKLPGLAHAMNAVIFVSVVSSGNANAYASTRTLMGLADIGLAPKFIGKCDKAGRPWVSVVLTFLLSGGLSYLNVSNSGATVFGWFSNLTTLCVLWNWGGIMLCNLRFRMAWKAQGRDEKEIPWRSWAYPYSAIWGLSWCIILIIVQFYLAVWPMGAKQGAQEFFANWVSMVALLVLYACCRIYFRGRWWIPLKEIDLDADMRTYPAEIDEESKSKSMKQKLRDFAKKA
ncbi:hypothetical protein KEM56_006826 [Ascosphaera pollenicola]|nr:hypothetical protein KEM56_006826 [Ascosphaera pollenicola]